MNIQQVQYVLAVAEFRHFETAAEKCFVTQSTLSTMISRFEDEIGIKIFDRRKKPVEISYEGAQLIEQLKVINTELSKFKELTHEIKGEIKGELSIAVIPTIAPFLLPLFIQQFADRFPDLHIEVREQTTAEIIRSLKSRELDIGILSTPLNEKEIEEVKLYDEPFMFYDAGNELSSNSQADQLDMDKLCLLEEGHCMRTQVINLCEMHKLNLHHKLNFDYKAGSIDGLLRFVRANGASTLIPYLATLDFDEKERTHLSEFIEQIPFRSVGLVVHRHFVKKAILKELEADILKSISKVLPQNELKGDMLMPV